MVDGKRGLLTVSNYRQNFLPTDAGELIEYRETRCPYNAIARLQFYGKRSSRFPLRSALVSPRAVENNAGN